MSLFEMGIGVKR